ncbi:MAG: glycoside hydrolase [Fimbriimonadales bacterium]|nr:glycoside hydrolase [Fimbriimonadales bacterium]MDW8051363.1 sialidase family protein [Armatimonadota bacterium]
MLHILPGAEFVEQVEAWLQRLEAHASQLPVAKRVRLEVYARTVRHRLHNGLARQLGWMTRLPPLVEGERLLLPLYSDGFGFSLIAISENSGESWQVSAPILGVGAVQPTLLRRSDGTLVAFMRDNGAPPNPRVCCVLVRRWQALDRGAENSLA